MLSERIGLSKRTTFLVGSALDLAFEDESFDVVIMQHVAMNIEDRRALYEGIRRVLRSGGRYLIYDVVVQAGVPSYPLPWAIDASSSFLRTEAETKAALEAAGLVPEEWQVEGAQMAALLQPPPGAPPPLLAKLLGRADFPQVLANFSAALVTAASPSLRQS